MRHRTCSFKTSIFSFSVSVNRMQTDSALKSPIRNDERKKYIPINTKSFENGLFRVGN